MEKIILNKKEYNELLKIKKLLEKILTPKVKKKREIPERAFGLLKKSFGKESSAFYVSKMRRSWR